MITGKQLKILHYLLNNNKLMDYKRDLVMEFSKGRCESSKKLTEQEAQNLIDHLNELDPSDKMRKKIISICYQIGMIYGDSAADKKMNQAKVYAFIKKIGYLKKDFNSYSRSELTKLIYQVEQILVSSKKKEERELLQNQEVENEIRKLLYESLT